MCGSVQSQSHGPSSEPHGIVLREKNFGGGQIIFDPVWIVPWTTHIMFSSINKINLQLENTLNVLSPQTKQNAF